MPAEIAFFVVAGFIAAPIATGKRSCVQLAEDLVKKVESLPMHKRGRVIEFAIRRDMKILCGVVTQDFFSSTPEAPAGCDRTRPRTCLFSKGLQVSETLADDAGIEVYLRVQTIATRLRERGLLTSAHERLLSNLLLSAAENARDHH